MSERDPHDPIGRALVEAHRDDAPPSFAALRVRRARPRRRWLLAIAPVATAGLVLVLVTARPRPAPPPELTVVAIADPLAFLLDVPGTETMRTVPTFDSQGVVP